MQITELRPSMISKADIRHLVERPPSQHSPVLSVYLDINQGEAVNLKRRFDLELKDRLRLMGERLDREKSKHFSADAQRVQEFVAGFEPHGKGLVIFSDDSADLFWSSVVAVPVQTALRWSETAWVTPLMSMLDDYERYGV